MSNKYFYIISLCLLLCSCFDSGHKLSFDVKNQTINSCNSSPIYHLSINNDSITKKGFPFEGGVLLSWDNTITSPPMEVNIQHIPSNYTYSKGGLESNLKYFKLKPNCSYLIEKWGFGKASFNIRVWTDSNGRVYKTTHPECH